MGRPKHEANIFTDFTKDPLLFYNDKVDAKRKSIEDFIEKKYKGRKVKVLYLSDLHIPFTDYETVMGVIEDHSDADILVINGDMLDLFAVSKYTQDKVVAVERELEEGREFLEYVSEIFGDIVITEGNHERRLRRMVQNFIPPEAQSIFPQDPLKIVADGHFLEREKLDNVHVVGTWWVNLWDSIIAHPDNYSSAWLKTVMNTSDHFRVSKGIPHRLCVIGHTHQAGALMYSGTLVMESGCCCHEMDYHNGSKFTSKPWVRAHIVAYFDENGMADLNNTKLILL